jgi:hypothetical protein
MPDDFTSSQRLADRAQDKEPFVSKARHIHRFNQPRRVSRARREAEKDRMVFLWVMAALVAVGVVVAVAMFIVNKSGPVE